MKINNKKWVVLIEALIAMSIFIWIVWGLAYIYSQVNNLSDKTYNILTLWTNKRIINYIEFLKERSMKLWEQTNYSKQNLKYAWWLDLKITDWNTESLNDLNWTYLLSSWVWCPSWLLAHCLIKVPDDKYWEIPVSRVFNTYKEDSSWKLILDTTEKQTIWDQAWLCEWEFSEDCIWYRLRIRDLSSDKSPNLDFIDWNGNNISVKSKFIEVDINNWINIETYNYILSPL